MVGLLRPVVDVEEVLSVTLVDVAPLDLLYKAHVKLSPVHLSHVLYSPWP